MMKANLSNDDHVLNETSDITDYIDFPGQQEDEENHVDKPKLEKESKQTTNLINDESLFWAGSERAKIILRAASKSQTLSNNHTNNLSSIAIPNKNTLKKSESGLDNVTNFSFPNSPTIYKKRKASFQNSFPISPISSSLYSRGSTFLKALQDQKNSKSTISLSSNNIDNNNSTKATKDLVEVSLNLNHDNTPLVPILKSISTDSSKKKKVLFTEPVVSNKLYFDSSCSTLKGSNTELIDEQSEEKAQLKVKRKQLDISVIGSSELEIEEIKCDDNETPIKRSRTLLNEDGKANVETCLRKINPNFRNIFCSLESDNYDDNKIDKDSYDFKVEAINEKESENSKMNFLSHDNKQISKDLIKNSPIINDISTNITKSFELYKSSINENDSLISSFKDVCDSNTVVELPELVNLTEIKTPLTELMENFVDSEISQSDINISHEKLKKITNITTNFSPIKCFVDENKIEYLKYNHNMNDFKADIDNHQHDQKLLQMNTSKKDDCINLNLTPQKSILRSNNSSGKY